MGCHFFFNPGIKPASPVLLADSFTTEPSWKPAVDHFTSFSSSLSAPTWILWLCCGIIVIICCWLPSTYNSAWRWKWCHVWHFVTSWLYSPWNSPGQNTGVRSLSFLQGIFPTQGLNPGLLHYRRILYQLNHKESPRILEWVAYPFSSGSSQRRNRSEVSCIAGRFFTNWAIRDTIITRSLLKLMSQ